MKLSSACAGCFAGLACQTRVEIVNLLKEKEQIPVGGIVEYFGLAQPTITHHLQYLKDVGVLASKKRGRRIYYYITEKCKKGECGLFR